MGSIRLQRPWRCLALLHPQGLQLKLSPEAFFRPNLFLTDAVLGQVLEMAQLDTETEASEVLWDAGLHHGK
jgi:tRNA/tmRNA/rRNA uracil-C5-methylase (TrmA/RlmC/RlmD family)